MPCGIDATYTLTNADASGNTVTLTLVMGNVVAVSCCRYKSQQLPLNLLLIRLTLLMKYVSILPIPNR
jgi:hypothetical protein